MRKPLGVPRRIACCCSLLLAVLATDAWALFVVNEPWLLPAKSGRDTEVYMNLTSTEGARVIKVTTDDARRIAIRAAGKNSATMTELALPAKQKVALSPSKQRLALTGLRRTFELGDHLVLTLTIEDASGARQEIPVTAEARLRSPIDDERLARHQHEGHSHAH